MTRYRSLSGGLSYVLPLLAFALIGSTVASAQGIDAMTHPIQNVTATSNTTSEEGAGPENTVNGSGLNADGAHSTKITDMWLGEPGDEPMYIQFEFDAVYELSEMHVWNYNVMFELMLGLGVKDATVEYSEDGSDWTVLSGVRFAQATASADYTANTIVPLGGISAKYVRLTGLDNWGLVEAVGLSEVRFYPISTVASIRNISATSNAISEEDAGPENTVNGSGLNANGAHSTRATDMWLGEPGDEPVYIQYEFDKVYELQAMWVWNYNAKFEFLLGLGVRVATIEYSENGVDWTVLDEVQFAQAPAEADYAANTIVPLAGVSAKYVRLADLDNWGLVEAVGLSEVKFFAEKGPASPVPSYTLLLDSFEAYNDEDMRLYLTWIDGYGSADNGSVVGHLAAPFAEREIVHTGLQSMPLFYDNSRPASYSEAYKDLEAEHQDWRVDDANALTLYFHGSIEKDHNIETDRLYVVVEDDRDGVAMVYHPDPEALLSGDWQEWTISFDEFGDVDLRHVERLTLGVGDSSNPQRGGNSIVYIDDIGLTSGASQVGRGR